MGAARRGWRAAHARAVVVVRADGSATGKVVAGRLGSAVSSGRFAGYMPVN
jgi:hypothetical protein